ncbi:interferon-induced GTP-binding protein Mx1 [Colletotrichum kahawae]|uniref:Interferon-induced GTP-binding protein Mx1 n=1 Tax=Colletotrichum kahawae TaxID=34407 RepID=A0AAE0D390_COLKA|nr:interferon-induced GTP-binding protein Mx1 [Colletotrichum kahawae]
MLPGETGLGNQATLAKIDKLRELNVGAIIPLPQITCRRGPEKGIIVSIIPRPDADETLKAKLLQFKRHLSSIDGSDLASVFEEANIAMGIRMGAEEKDVGSSAFSQDILKIEISGPDQQHLTVIDVPGIFRVSTPGRL